MTEDRKAKMLFKVRALLAQADSTTHEEEAATFRAKADELMTLYAIEEWQLGQADPTKTVRPERRFMDASWWLADEQREHLWSLFQSVASYARCQIVTRDARYGVDSRGERVEQTSDEYSRMRLSVLGMPADLDYMDLLFTQLILDMSKRLRPGYNPQKSLDENVYAMRMAGMGWPAIAHLLYEQGVIDLPRGHSPLWHTEDRQWRALSPETQQSMRSRCASRYRDYAKANGLQKNYVDPKVYHRSFAAGYADRIWQRLYEMRRQRDNAQSASDGNPYALVVRDTAAMVMDLYKELYPPVETKKRKGRRSTAVDKRVYSDSAMSAGTAAGDRANIASRDPRLRNRKEIGQ